MAEKRALTWNRRTSWYHCELNRFEDVGIFYEFFPSADEGQNSQLVENVGLRTSSATLKVSTICISAFNRDK